MSKNSLDRVQKWGKLLTELSEINRNCQEKNIRERAFNYKKQKFLAYYLSLEEKAKNFQPEKLTNKLSWSIKSGTSSPQTVLLHDFKLDSKDNYKYLILEAFKTKAFLKAFWVEKMRSVPRGLLKFIEIAVVSSTTIVGVWYSRVPVLHLYRNHDFNTLFDWSMFACLVIIVLFALALCICWIWLMTSSMFGLLRYTITEGIISWCPSGNNIVNTVTITNHRQIKLPELRLLFLELEKFQLKPNLLITKDYKDKVTFELKVKSNPDLIGLLE